ncbi:MAG: 16S rRNA (uracil(1498)-N(3))-methyltransferase [Bacteroidetes bacterium MedPE-SWsnd-G2]|nr:MAG: 16S rRNA (uracil(1498)-N(3))-methyltransferase [Bacteroidetes bacterium MedPE-SWsnd-G2]
MQLFYNSSITHSQSEIQFSKEESKHIVKVLRKKEGDILHITNGKGQLFQVELGIADVKNCLGQIVSTEDQEKREYAVHLVVAPTKMNDRFEWFLEKATEIGVDTITPILCDHSERKIIKAERFEKIIVSAMKQSLSCYLPKLNPLIGFNEFISTVDSDHKFIAHCEDGDKSTLFNSIKSKSNICILIGPEGDFSINEIEKAISAGFKPVSLGESRLRTETAAIVACHTVALKNDN